MMDMLYIAISSSVVVHKVNSDVVALLDVGKQVVCRMDRIVFNLEVGKCLDVQDFYFHGRSGQLLDEKFLSGV